MATRFLQLIVLALAIAACGGHKAQPASPSGDGDGVSQNPCQGDNADMCPPETMDRIKEALDSKRVTMSRCLSDAQTSGNAEKNAKGVVTVEFVITTSGKPRDVKVGKSTVQSKAVDQCVVAHVEQMAFPTVPKDLPWSYTYGFESN